MNHFRLIFSLTALILLAAGIVFSGRLFAHEFNCEGNPEVLAEARRAWHGGNLLVLVRHAEKCEDDRHNCPSGDTSLTPEGVSQARHVSTGIHGMGPEPVDVYTSPAARTYMTAGILDYSLYEPADWLSGDCKTGMLDKIMSIEVPGRNMIAVTHSHCLNALNDRDKKLIDLNTGDDAYFGASFLFRFRDPAPPEAIGCVLPRDWPTGNTSH